MGRTRGTSYALQILSKNLGWDPTEFIGEVYKSPEVLTSDTSGIPESANTPHHSHPGSQNHSFNTPELRENQKHGTHNADPYPGMPGSK